MKSAFFRTCCGLFAYGLSTVAVQATVLTFDIDGIGNFDAMPQTYGDNVVAADNGDFHYGTAGGITPNIAVSYADPDGNDITYWSTGFNDLVGVLNNEDDGETGYNVTFSAESGFNASLDSFALGNFSSAITLPGITITDGNGNTLFSQLNTLLPASSDSPLLFSFSGLSAQEINLHIDTTGLGSSSDNVGLDNIQFSQVSTVPVPAAAWLFGSGLIGLLGLGKRSPRKLS